MKKLFVLSLLLVSVFAFNTGAFAQNFFVYENSDDSEETIKIPIDPAHYIGTVRFCVEQIQQFPADINNAICEGDDEAYNTKMAELASNIAQANSAMADAGIPNRLNLWNVYSILKAKHCGSGAEATAYADWAREELDRVGFRIGAIDPAYAPNLMCGNIPFNTYMNIASPSAFQECSNFLTPANCANMIVGSCNFNSAYPYNNHYMIVWTYVYQK